MPEKESTASGKRKRKYSWLGSILICSGAITAIFDFKQYVPQIFGDAELSNVFLGVGIGMMLFGILLLVVEGRVRPDGFVIRKR